MSPRRPAGEKYQALRAEIDELRRSLGRELAAIPLSLLRKRIAEIETMLRTESRAWWNLSWKTRDRIERVKR